MTVTEFEQRLHELEEHHRRERAAKLEAGDELMGHPPPPEEEKWEEYLDRLDNLSTLAHFDNVTPDAFRWAAIESLKTVLEIIPFTTDTKVLSRLLQGLVDLDAGHRVEWMRKKVKGRPKTEEAVQRGRGTCAASMEVLMRDPVGLTMDEAAKFVAKNTPARAREWLAKNWRASEIERWREECHSAVKEKPKPPQLIEFEIRVAAYERWRGEERPADLVKNYVTWWLKFLENRVPLTIKESRVDQGDE